MSYLSQNFSRAVSIILLLQILEKLWSFIIQVAKVLKLSLICKTAGQQDRVYRVSHGCALCDTLKSFWNQFLLITSCIHSLFNGTETMTIIYNIFICQQLKKFWTAEIQAYIFLHWNLRIYSATPQKFLWTALEYYFLFPKKIAFSCPLCKKFHTPWG